MASTHIQKVDLSTPAGFGISIRTTVPEATESTLLEKFGDNSKLRWYKELINVMFYGYGESGHDDSAVFYVDLASRDIAGPLYQQAAEELFETELLDSWNNLNFVSMTDAQVEHFIDALLRG